MNKKENRKNPFAGRTLFDRRTGDDRRRVYKLGYFVNGGVERRKIPDRRCNMERRKDPMWLEDCRGMDKGN